MHHLRSIVQLSPLHYTANLNLNLKVLELVQFGGPNWTVGSTIFEMWLGAL